MNVKIFLHKSFVFAQNFHGHPLIRINCQNFELISLKISLNCVTFIKFTHVLDATAKWSTSQTRPQRREASQQRQPEVILAVISLPLAVPDTRRRRILSSLIAWSLKRRHKRRKSMSTSYRSASHQVSIRLSVAILTAYAFCIAPHSIYVFIRTFMWHWQDPPICAFKTVIPFVSCFMVFSWSAINPCICFTFSKNYQNGLNGIITARSGATNLQTTTGTTTLRKRATSSGTDRICLRVIEKEEEDDEKQDKQKEGQEELRLEGEEDYQEITEVRTERRSDEEAVLRKEWEEEGQI